MLRIILFGAPGSGKGTQAQLLEAKYGYKQISTGDLVRAEIKAGSPVGKKVKEITEKGELVPDEIIIEIFKNRVTRGDISGGYILDGFPRTIPQAEALSQIGADREKAVFLRVDEQAVIQRLSMRLTCGKCGAIFNLKNKPPQKEGVCDICGAPLEKRSDDHEDSIRHRIDVYRGETEPVIAYYREKGDLDEVDATLSGEEVFGKIEELLS